MSTLPNPTPNLNPDAMRRLHTAIEAFHSGERGPLTQEELAAFASDLKPGARVRLTLDTIGARTRLVIRIDEPPRSTRLLASLSKREREVALLVAHGLSNLEIAARLSLSIGTVKDHVHHILTRLNLKSRVAVARALADACDSWPAE
jgi:DNA-binding NarL/FixJ family response regulator